MMTPTPKRAHKALTIAASLALVALPAAAAVQAQGSAPDGSSGAVVADAAVTAAPTVTAPPAAAADNAGSDATAVSTSVGDVATASAPARTASEAGAVAVPSDETGSTEATTVQRSCGAAKDSHYLPSSGRDASQCYDGDGKFQQGRKYPATHFTNDVECGEKNLQGGVGAVGLWISGTGGADGGYVSVCSDDQLPVQGRATVRGSAAGTASVTVDGDGDNPEETTQGWMTATVTSGGPSYRCGKSYAEGGRGTSDAPTSADTADECG